MSNIIKTISDLSINDINRSKTFNNDYKSVFKFFKNHTDIDIPDDKMYVEMYEKDWSNIKGHADIVARPKNSYECSLLMLYFSEIRTLSSPIFFGELFISRGVSENLGDGFG